MAEAYKVLGQLDVPATTLSDVYTVPGSTEAVVSTIVLCNRNSAARTVRLAIAPAGAADNVAHYVVYDYSLRANDTFAVTIGATLAATDKIRAYASAAGVTVNVFGTEIT